MATVEVRIPWWRGQDYYDQDGRGTLSRDGGGVLITQAIHTLDIMLLLCGPVKEVQGMIYTSSLHKLEAEDFSGGDILDGHHSVEEKGRQIYEMILKVASGEKSKSELQGLGDYEFVPWQIGAVM